MNATNHSTEQKQTRESWHHAFALSRAEAAATMGLVALVAILMAVASGSALLGSGPGRLPAMGKRPIVRYVSSGQIVADVRTAVAMVRYLLDPELPLLARRISKL